MKLHLGCGGTYLDGYINIDFPPNEKTIMKVKADIYKDIRTLEYADNSIDEIRSHHLFEHFNRAEAVEMLLRWRRWLKVGGKLVIETPDFFWCGLIFIILPFKFKMRVGRHIFGSQEDRWADHLDFWYRKKFKKVLSAMGFENFHFSHPIYGNLLPNIKVVCEKTNNDIDESVVKTDILEWYLLPKENKEKFLNNWLSK